MKGPQQKLIRDRKNDFLIDGYEGYQKCKLGQDIMAYTISVLNTNKKGQLFVQLCPWYLKSVGQTPFLSIDDKPQNKKMHDSLEVTHETIGQDIHSNDFAQLELTLFHEVCLFQSNS